MELKDLLEKPASECTDEELEKQAHLLSKLKISFNRSSSKSRPKSNQSKQLSNLLSKLPKDKLEALIKKLSQEVKE